jgi:hypothetical protein
MGPTPAQGGGYHVEFEIPEDIEEWRTVASDRASISGSVDTEAGISITGEVGNIGDGDDPVVELKVGSGILLVEILNRKSELARRGFISFRSPDIQLYPYDL